LRLDPLSHRYQVWDESGNVQAQFSNLKCAAASVYNAGYGLRSDVDHVQRSRRYLVLDTVTKNIWDYQNCMHIVTMLDPAAKLRIGMTPELADLVTAGVQ
jgi:hypothetical protein